VLTIKRSRELKIVIPVETAHLLCERADERWHSRTGFVQGQRRSVIQVWPARSTRMGVGVVPIGSFTIQWGAPLPSQASIVQLEWDVDHDGSEIAIRQAINSLVGWPIANDNAPPRGRSAA
jgi:hypothetical protein